MKQSIQDALYLKQPSAPWREQHEAFQAQTGLLATVFGFARVTSKKFPLLHDMVAELAANKALAIKKPMVLVFQGNIISWLVAHLFGYSLTLRTYSLAFTKNTGIIIVGNAMVETAATDQLQASVARQLGHIKCLHVLKSVISGLIILVQFPLLLVLGPASVALIFAICLAYLFMLRKFVRNADLLAAEVIESPLSVADALVRLPLVQLAQPLLYNAMMRIVARNPLVSDRITYLKEAAEKKNN